MLSTSVAQQIEINNKLAGKLARDESATEIESELKQGIRETLSAQYEQNRNVLLVRKVRGLKIAGEIQELNAARDRIELPTRGFSVLVP